MDKIVLAGLWLAANGLELLMLKSGNSFLAAIAIITWGPLILVPFIIIDWWIKGMIGGEIFKSGYNHYKKIKK